MMCAMSSTVIATDIMDIMAAVASMAVSATSSTAAYMAAYMVAYMVAYMDLAHSSMAVTAITAGTATVTVTPSSVVRRSV